MTDPRRIAFVHDSWPGYRERLFQLLAGRNRLAFFFINEDPRRLPPNSVSVRGIRLPRFSDYVVAPSLYGRILAEHKRDPFSAVFCPEPSFFSAHAAWRAARTLNLPYLVWSGEWLTAAHPRRRLMRPLERAIISGAEVCLAYSRRTAGRLEEYGATPSKILVTGNASPYAFTAPDPARLREAREKLNLDGRPVILFLGRLMTFKAPDLLLDAFALVRSRAEARLVIAGTGPLLPALVRRARTLGLADVRFTGAEVRGAAEKDALYGLATVFALPSRKARVAEPWGLVVNEAASAGLPIVVSDHVGAAGDFIRDGENGTVVPEGNAAALADALQRYLRDPDLAKRHGEQARRTAAAFTVEGMAGVFAEGFDRVLRAAGAGR